MSFPESSLSIHGGAWNALEAAAFEFSVFRKIAKPRALPTFDRVFRKFPENSGILVRTDRGAGGVAGANRHSTRDARPSGRVVWMRIIALLPE